MGRGASQTVSTPLPKVSFTKVEDDGSTQPAGVHDHSARAFGYNDFSNFQRPEHYIRYIEPLESELSVQTEYDMDEQDQEWLDAVNAERRKDGIDKVSYELFEIIMDRLEKEWFDLTKTIPKPEFVLPSEDSTCAICDDPEGENSNAIVFCDGCNLAVHQDCYGVPYIPEGQWLCRKCTVSPENPVSCILCPNEGGAFKQTSHGDWVHLLCAIWVPETRVANDVFMEPITGVEKISKQRWKLKCSVCDVREGACIQCSKASCFLAFHVTCARKEKFLMPMKSTHGTEPAALTCYCEKHLPKEQYDARMKSLAQEQQATGSEGSPKLSKSARAYAKTYKPGPPLVPAIIVDRITQYTDRMNVRKKTEFLLLVCKYWSLKREARRGAPLLKRLHLEPWTASAVSKQQTDEERGLRLNYLKRLRDDLQNLRAIAELSRKRESRKLGQARLIDSFLSLCLFSHEPPMRLAFEKIMGLDRNSYFKNPVSAAEVPDYFDIVKHPMCWSTIDEKLERHEYWDVQAFKNDIQLVVDNAILYNRPGTPYHKTALKVQNGAQPIMDDLLRLLSNSEKMSGQELSAMDVDSSLTNAIGDLEPSVEVLKLLLSEDAVKNDVNIILDNTPLQSLFSYELPKKKPPRTPTPPPPPKAKRGRRPAVAAVQRAALDGAPGFRAPRTRRAVASTVASVSDTRTNEVNMDLSGEKNVAQRKSRSRLSAGPSRQPETPAVVEDIGKRELFSLFEHGWILPDNVKRGGRVTVERVVPPAPAKKRSRTSREVSHPTDPSHDTATLHQQAKPVPAIVEVPAIAETMDKFEPVSDTHVDNSILGSARKEEHSLGQLIPHSESSRPMVDSIVTSSLQETTGPSAQRSIEEDRASDLSSLSELDTEDDKEAEPEDNNAYPGPSNVASSSYAQANAQAPLPKLASNLDAGTFRLSKGQVIEGGTLVWAKAATFPWWPAVIFEKDDPVIPASVAKGRKAAERNSKGPVHLVQFYDKAMSWQWLQLDRLKKFGEDNELDEDLIATHSKRQRWRSGKIRTECRAAFRRAKAEMETNADGGESDTSEGQADGLESADNLTEKEASESDKPGDIGLNEAMS